MEKTKFLNTATSVICAEVLVAPVCTVRTEWQTHFHPTFTSTIKKIYSNGGMKGFFLSSIPASLSQMTSTTLKLYSYKFLNNSKIFGENKVVNSVISGVGVSLLTHPKDVMRVFVQKNKSIVQGIKEEKLNFFYRGYSKTFFKTLTGSCIYFPLNDFLREKGISPFSASLFTAIVGTTITQPLDFLKTNHINENKVSYSFNIKYYYRGYSLSLLKNVPSFIVVMTLLDFLEK